MSLWVPPDGWYARRREGAQERRTSVWVWIGWEDREDKGGKGDRRNVLLNISLRCIHYTRSRAAPCLGARRYRMRNRTRHRRERPDCSQRPRSTEGSPDLQTNTAACLCCPGRRLMARVRLWPRPRPILSNGASLARRKASTMRIKTQRRPSYRLLASGARVWGFSPSIRSLRRALYGSLSFRLFPRSLSFDLSSLLLSCSVGFVKYGTGRMVQL